MFPTASRHLELFGLIVLHLLIAPDNGCASAGGGSCHEVKTAYMMRQIGPVELVPDKPRTDESLRVCLHPGPTCCTGKMEESYMAAVRGETQQKIQSYSFELKYLIAGHIKAYQETFDSLIFFTSNLTSSLFDSAYSALASECRPLVFQLFNDIKRHLSGDPHSSLDSTVRQFYDNLFPLVYRRLLNPGFGPAALHSYSPISNAHDDCLRMTRQDVGPFGPHPRLLVSGLSRALGVGRALNRLLQLASEVVNATQKMAISRECGRGLVRMQYCSHCRGLTLIRPCNGLCINVMRGCLIGISELDVPWRRLVVMLQQLAAALATSSNQNSMELALLAIRNQVNDAILHAQLHGPHISATVEKVCGPLEADPVITRPKPATSHDATSSSPATSKLSEGSTSKSSVSHQQQQLQPRRSFPLKDSKSDKSRNLKKLSRDFEGSIQRYQWLFSELPEMLCESETETEHQTCWSGQDIAESYPGRVVGSTLKAQRENPEMTVRHTDLDLKRMKHRLEQLTQELLVELGWAREGRRRVEEEKEEQEEEEEGGSTHTDTGSGNECDDEDGCEASGEEMVESSSGRSPETRPVVRPPPRAHLPLPPQQISPTQDTVRGSAHTTTTGPVSSTLVTLLLLLLLSAWEPH